MATKKKHHYIPQFYLDGFTDLNNGHVWVYEKGNLNIRKAKTGNIAFQKHYYSFVTKEGNKDSETLENAFAEMEGKAAPVFQKIKKCERLGEQERAIFACFLAFSVVRVPKFRGYVESDIAKSYKSLIKIGASHSGWLKSIMESVERDTREKINIEELQEYILHGSYNIKVNPQYSLKMFKLVEDLIPIFYGMKWTFLIATGDYKFVTSDNPLFWCDPTHNPYIHSIYHLVNAISLESFIFYIKKLFSWSNPVTPSRSVGLLNKDVEVTFPISRDVAFLGTWKIKGGDYLKANNYMIKDLNYRTITSALRFVYSSQKSDEVNALVRI